MTRSGGAAAAVALLLAACGSGGRTEEGGAAPGPAAPAPPTPAAPPRPANCPDHAAAPDPLPGIDPATLTADYWVGRVARADDVVLEPDEIYNLAVARGQTPPGPPPAPGKAKKRRRKHAPVDPDLPPPLSRQAWLQAALAHAGEPIAGDPVAALLAGFGLPADGSFTIDLTPVASGDERLLLVEAAASAGLVLVEAGDHRMVWLGRDQAGAPRVLHAVDSYPARCVSAAPDAPADTRMDVGKVMVTGLDLGAGSAAGSLLQRLTRVTLYARTTGPALAGAVTERPAAPVAVPRKCDDRSAAAIFFSPLRPSRERPMRAIATLSRDPGPVELALFDPAGKRVTPAIVRLGGPPWSYVVTVPEPTPGRWTAVVGDGTRVVACSRVTVDRRTHPRYDVETGPIWAGTRHRTEGVANLYAAFVQRLFDYPVDQDLTWPNLHTLLRDRDHNILYDHLGYGEDELLVLEPDCADLPYTLESYFSWKLNLPYGFLVCTRGTGRKPPHCKGPDEITPDDPPADNLMVRDDFKKKDAAHAFQEFSYRVFRGVSSSSGRTAPDDENTDWYPVALTRDTLRPGTLFADPYGHLLVVAAWYPQKPGGYGILMGADAQPDATVGRRRFWRGNYLFTADTTRAGSGFKAYRPRSLDATTGLVTYWDNKRLKARGWWPRLSEQQYAGTTDDFYDAMEALINPRPLDALQMQVSLVDALQEAVVRRVNSVDNGEKYMATATEPVPMPEGAAIFLTSGPWEDYSTPARDHRILIAIDTVLGLSDAVRRHPERFRLQPGQVDAMLARLKTNLDALLTARKFLYTRSDGQPQQLSLKDVVDRAAAFEMGYNPNDCPEIRWGAPEGSAEMASCQRHAPPEQREIMENKFRVWFRNRERPVE